MSSLPTETQLHLQDDATADAAGPTQLTFPSATLQTSGHLKDWQRRRAEARLAILQEVAKLSKVAGLERARVQIVTAARKGTLSPHLQELVQVANARSGTGIAARSLSVRTLARWHAAEKMGSAALAPMARPDAVPPWAAAFLRAWRKPAKPSIRAAVRALEVPGALPDGVEPPSYDQARRFLARVGEVEKERGRRGPRELKNLRPFVRRDSSALLPTDVYTADGHTFDAEVAHPEHGRPFRPEVTLVIDVATRRVVGWSVALAESGLAVLDALRHAATSCGIPAILYVDNGTGYKNAMMTAQATGLMARLGIELTHSLPYNSQARGVVERAHRTVLVDLAKRLPTYMGAAMDPEAKKLAFRRTRGNGEGLVAWPRFLELVAAQVGHYNDRPHAALKGRTPDAAWEAAVAGGAPIALPEPDPDLFRPQLTRTARRGEISLFGNLYFSRELEEWNGQELAVAYDVHDAARVWVRDREGRLICEALCDGNKRDYFPMPFVEAAREKRARGRLRRLEAKRDEVIAEGSGPGLLPEVTGPEPWEIEEARARHPEYFAPEPEEAPANVVPLTDTGRPRFTTDREQYLWLRAHPEAVDGEDEAWLAWFRSTSEWRILFSDKEAAEEGGQACAQGS